MPTPPQIEIDALLAPIEGESPAGNTVPFVLRKKMDDARKEVNPDSFAADDPRRPEQPIVADWSGIQRMTTDTLATSKDLMLAARLTEALAKKFGFSGVRDGMQLMRRLVDEAWDRIHPVIEDNDVEPRASAFNWLGDPDRGAFFPGTIRQVPIVFLESAGFGWQAWRDLQDGKGKVEQADFDKAVSVATYETCTIILEDIALALDEVGKLGGILDAKMADHSPSLAEISRALTDCQSLAQEIQSRKRPAAVPQAETPVETAGSGVAPVAAARPPEARGNSREEIYARLAEASGQLMKLEPHSPVAYMVQRAVKLGHLTLPELIKVLVRDQAVLKQLDRDLDLGFDQGGGDE